MPLGTELLRVKKCGTPKLRRPKPTIFAPDSAVKESPDDDDDVTTLISRPNDKIKG